MTLSRLKWTLLCLTLSGLLCQCSPLARTEQSRSKSQHLNLGDLTSLEFGKVELLAHIESKTRRTKQTGSSFELWFWRKGLGNQQEGPFIDPDLRICVKPWMKMENGIQHGSAHSTPVSIEFNEVEGTFTIDPVFFTMSGVWELWIELCSKDAQCKENGYGGCPDEALIERAARPIIVE